MHLELMAQTDPGPRLWRATGRCWQAHFPSGAPPDFYADLVRRLREVGGRVAVDTSEAPLQALVDALPGSAPDLMKPNGEELASFTGGDAERARVRPGGHRGAPRAS